LSPFDRFTGEIPVKTEVVIKKEMLGCPELCIFLRKKTNIKWMTTSISGDSTRKMEEAFLTAAIP